MDARGQKEIKILKNLVKAQSRMIIGYKIGKPMMPDWVFKAFDKATKFYGVANVADIK